MRILLLLLVAVAGCGSSTNSNDMQSGNAMDLAVAACPRTLDGYCALQTPGYCVRTLAAAQQASTWCPAGGGAHGTVTQTNCSNGQTVIVVAYTDNSDHFVYDSSGALVAVFSSLPHQELSCSGGPGSFAAPAGCDTPTTICA